VNGEGGEKKKRGKDSIVSFHVLVARSWDWGRGGEGGGKKKIQDHHAWIASTLPDLPYHLSRVYVVKKGGEVKREGGGGKRSYP